MRRITAIYLGLMLLGGGFFLLAPLLYRSLSLFVFFLMYLALTQSFNLIYGYTGYVPFGHVAFFGVGAYTTAILRANYGVPMLPAILGGAVVAQLLALLVMPTLRLRGVYFAIVNFSISEAMRVICANLPTDFSGGSFGISLSRYYNPVASYYAMLAVAALALLTVWWVTRARLHIRLKAIKEDDLAAEVLGIDTTRAKALAWQLTALFPGLAGGVNAWFTAVVDPSTAFNSVITVTTITYTVFGGAGTLIGPVLGTLVLYALNDFVWSLFPFANLLVFGLVLTGVVLLMPQGVVGLLVSRFPRLRSAAL
ncbi:MAG: branched-chain amino acid ABC transporter permease [Candidatus Tectimicrobiota bacterium]|nr:MAG: branched-chain amino acid ABC transporter permease [Candidatus Tectomicrobia bacterium]